MGLKETWDCVLKTVLNISRGVYENNRMARAV